MPSPAAPSKRLLEMLFHATVGLLRRDGPDLSARQLAVFLVCYLEEGPHTVSGLAAHLLIGRPAAARSLRWLCAAGLARRTRKPRDRRGVVVQRTRRGQELLADLRGLVVSGAEPAIGKQQR